MFKKFVIASFALVLMVPLAAVAGDTSTSTTDSGAVGESTATASESTIKTSDCDPAETRTTDGKTSKPDCEPGTTAGSGSGTKYSGNKEAGY